MADKRALYFAAGASEVWLFCRDDGSMDFFASPEGPAGAKSVLCPGFPASIE